MGSKALVTGGAGFIGSHVVDELIKFGCEVVVLDDLSGGFKENVHPKATLVQGSITNNKLVHELFEKHRFDYVFHLAAYAAEGLSHFIRRFNYENNLIGSINLINAAVHHDVKCFVFTSSIAVYGKNQLPMHENMEPHPEDPYGIAKLAVEHDLKAAHQMFGMPYVIFRPHNVYGERQNLSDKYRNVIGIFMNQIMQSKPLTIFGDGKQTRAFSYIGDVAPAIAKSAFMPEAYNQVFNIGADTPFSVNELMQVVGKEFGVKAQVHYLEARNEVVHAHSAHEKAKAVFGITKETPLAEGIQKMAAWAKQAGIQSSAPFTNIELHKNMPPSWAQYTK